MSRFEEWANGSRFGRWCDKHGGRYGRWCERHPKASYATGIALLLAPLVILQIFY